VPLASGSRLGPYEVIAQIGAGGMGEVYQAKDSRLKRDVALKVLPDSFAQDPDRLARFQREAELLATLNHPNIAGIYGLEESNGVRALVLELVEGPTLADRIAQGPIPIDEALLIAGQIADALEAAHEKGVIHRDLKPANIKVTSDDKVKVLDFGLAKMLETPVAPAALSMSPTLSVHATYAGVILGTAAYMSPEQARGKAVDKRTDIWAFGCVLYEMLTGKAPFRGEDVAEVIGAIIHKEVAWDRLHTSTPAAVRMVLARCLEKDPKERVRDIGDVRLALEGAFDVASPATPQTLSAPRQPLWRRVAFVGVPALVIGGVIAGGATWIAEGPSSPQPVRFTIVPPATQPLAIHGFHHDLAITPDGRHIVYRTGLAGTPGAGRSEGTQLAVRSLDQLDARVLTGITAIRGPFVSPDGRWIGFFGGTGGGGELKKVSILGGPPITLCKYTGIPGEASWGPDDTIIFATGDETTGLLSVAGGGGEPRVLTTPDRARGEADHLQPFILPGGRAVVFTISPAQARSADNAQIAVLDLKTGQKKVLIRGGSDARYVNTGHLVYAASGTLRAVRFDLGRLEVTSDPVPVVEKVTMSGVNGMADYALSQSGTLAYVPGGAGGDVARSLTWVTRQGKEDPIKAAPRAYQLARISPDGTRVALEARDQENDIWVWDLKRETLERLTFDPGVDQRPVWTPDSRRILFSSVRGGVQNLYWQAADGSGTIERLTTSQHPQSPVSISPDGTRVLFEEFATTTDVGMLTLTTGTAPVPRPTEPLLQTKFNERNAEVSPDGRWVAYQSNESGLNQVYVRPFPKVDLGRRQVSSGIGSRPVWARSGHELFYTDVGALWAVIVQTTGAVFSAGNPTRLFATAPYYTGTNDRAFDVSADGQRFLMIKNASVQDVTASSPSLVVVEHWTEELKQRVPTK
jgi:serine/threonine-protein kinase